MSMIWKSEGRKSARARQSDSKSIKLKRWDTRRAIRGERQQHFTLRIYVNAPVRNAEVHVNVMKLNNTLITALPAVRRELNPARGIIRDRQERPITCSSMLRSALRMKTRQKTDRIPCYRNAFRCTRAATCIVHHGTALLHPTATRTRTR